jgi:hypothetical protein
MVSQVLIESLIKSHMDNYIMEVDEQERVFNLKKAQIDVECAR